MFKSYLQGLLGLVLSLIGSAAIIFLIFSIFAENLGVFIGLEISEPIFLIAGLVILFIGGYLRYLSRQTIRSENR